jgi:hypothetical protein
MVVARAGFEPFCGGHSVRSLPELRACSSHKFFRDGEPQGRGSKPARTKDRTKRTAMRAESRRRYALARPYSAERVRLSDWAAT